MADHFNPYTGESVVLLLSAVAYSKQETLLPATLTQFTSVDLAHATDVHIEKSPNDSVNKM